MEKETFRVKVEKRNTKGGWGKRDRVDGEKSDS